MENDFATGYALGSDNGGRSNGFFSGDGIWAIIIFAMIFGWGNGGFGGFGGGNGAATRADINAGFALNGLDNGIRGVQQGLCDGFYAVNTSLLQGFNGNNTAMLQGFNGIQAQLCNMSAQSQSCCCETQRLVERGFSDLGYNLATQSCETRQTISNSARDIIENQNAGTRAILDFLTKDKIATLQSENQALRFQASQSAQNSYLAALSDAQTAELIRRINPSPVPAYSVPAPYPYCGTGYSGCGC